MEGSIPIGTISEDTHGEIDIACDKHGAVRVESHDVDGLINMTVDSELIR